MNEENRKDNYCFSKSSYLKIVLDQMYELLHTITHNFFTLFKLKLKLYLIIVFANIIWLFECGFL